MKKISFITFGILLLFFVGTVSASSPYGDIDVYYNDQILPGKEIAKPVLKIGEPFKVRFDFSVYQKCYISIKLSELGENNFVIIDGPTSRIEEYYGKIMEKNSTEIFEWTVKPTENWAGGSIPIDFVYQVDELGAGGKTLVKGGFTVAYCTISNEYYEGETPSQTTAESENFPESAPALTTFGTFLALALAASRH